MAPSSTIPSVAFEAVPAREETSTLRTDIAAFIGRAKRGPVGKPVRLESWRAYEQIFGTLWQAAHTPYAVKAYFENGGRVAYVQRLGNGLQAAGAPWVVQPTPADFAPAELEVNSYRVETTTPGSWGNDVSVRISYHRNAVNGRSVDILVTVPGDGEERFYDLPLATLSSAVEERSRYIRITPEAAAIPILPGAGAGPASKVWPIVQLAGGSEGAAPVAADYVAALQIYTDEPEPAMLAMPDLHLDIADTVARHGVVQAAAQTSAANLDRIVIADLPQEVADGAAASDWLDGFGNDPAIHRAVASYHPWIAMNDPIGTILEPQRVVPPSGHVAGAISRSDLERGAYFTPANISLNGAVDLEQRLTAADHAIFNNLGINVLKCHAGRGLMIWGGRMTKSDNAPTHFVAHRRLVNRLVRALRRVAEPLVFESNDVQLWFALIRAATTLLLEAFRAGALKGKIPEEAFRVRCDEELNPPEVRDRGQAICEIAIAPAAPMEFITLRVALSADGKVEVVES